MSHAGAPRARVICAAEEGWHGMRRCSLEAARQGARVEVIIRGSLDPGLLSLITVPSGMSITAIGTWHRVVVALRLLAAALSRGPKALIVDKPRTAALLEPWARALGFKTFRLTETPEGFRFEGKVPSILAQPLAMA